MSRTALVIGCGGTIGTAWSIAALSAFAQQTGWDPADAAVLQGTSGGAEMVAMLGSGYRVEQLVDMQAGRSDDPVLARHIADAPPGLPPLPGLGKGHPSTLWTRAGGHAKLTGVAPRGRGDASWLQRLADSVSGDRWLPHPGARMVAYRLDDGERIAFGAPSAPEVGVGEALRASWAIPGWMPPVVVDGATYLDGGAASTASVDLIGTDEADRIVVIAPMASVRGVRAPGPGGIAEERLLRRPMSAVLDREADDARARGLEVVVLTPDADDMAALGWNFMDRDRRPAAFAEAVETASRSVARALKESEAAR